MSPPPKPPEPPESRPSDGVLERLIEVEASRYYARIKGSSLDHQAIGQIRALFTERVHDYSNAIHAPGKIPCELCGREPVALRYVNVHLPLPLRGERPTFVTTIESGEARSPAICYLCAERDWKAWEADVESIVREFPRKYPDDRLAASELGVRFQRRPVRCASGRCDLCGARGEGVQGRAFVCALCMSEASRDAARADAVRVKAWRDRERREEEEKNRPFPDDLREEARRVAAHLGARRARALGPLPEPQRGPDDAAWDEVRGWFNTPSGIYTFMRPYHERASASPPPADVVDLLAGRFAGLLESVALDGYRLRHQGRLGGAKAVVGESWVAHEVGAFLWTSRPSPAARAPVDEAMVLLRHVLASGVTYHEWNDDIYDDVTEHYLGLTRSLYDHRREEARALREGALLLHGGRAEDRLEIAREVHLARTGGLDELVKMPFVVIGRGEGEAPLLDAFERATVFIPEPLALSLEEQRRLIHRLRPSGPPEPTLLGADDEALFREQAQSRMLEDLVPRLYTFEQDIRRELARMKA